jgi:hypothetical protein
MSRSSWCNIINIAFSSSKQTPPDQDKSSTGFAFIMGWETYQLGNKILIYFSGFRHLPLNSQRIMELHSPRNTNPAGTRASPSTGFRV